MNKNETGINVNINGVDKTSKAFNSVQRNADKMSSRINNSVNKSQMSVNKINFKAAQQRFNNFGTASVAKGMIVAGIIKKIGTEAINTARELGTISDRAQDMQVTNEYAQKLSAGLATVGIRASSLEQLSMAFAKMAKTTGRQGAEGFEQTLVAVSMLSTEQERLTELSRVFGEKVGASFAPLVRQGPDKLKEGLKDVMAMMPAVANELVDMGDGVADSFGIVRDQMKVTFNTFLMGIMSKFGEIMGTTPQNAILQFQAIFTHAIQVIWRYVSVTFGNIVKFIFHFKDNTRVAFVELLSFIVDWAKAIGSQVLGWLVKLVSKAAMGLWAAVNRIWDKDAWAKFKERAATVDSMIDGITKPLMKKAKQKHFSIEFDPILTNDIDAQLDEKLTKINKFSEAKSNLATGIANATTEGAKKIAAALTESKFVQANSYEAFKIARKASSVMTGASIRAGYSVAGASTATGGTAGGSYSGESVIVQILRRIEEMQRSGWSSVRNIGVV